VFAQVGTRGAGHGRTIRWLHALAAWWPRQSDERDDVGPGGRDARSRFGKLFQDETQQALRAVPWLFEKILRLQTWRKEEEGPPFASRTTPLIPLFDPGNPFRYSRRKRGFHGVSYIPPRPGHCQEGFAESLLLRPV